MGTQVVLTLMEESRTTNRWCLIVVMGRKAGHLALSIGKAAGFASDRITLDELCLVLEGAILKRRSLGREDGLAVISEGVAAKIDPAELAALPGVEIGYDAYGNIRLEKIPVASVIERELSRRFSERGESRSFVPVTLGYELRCAAPIPFDIDYTRTLGYGAVRFLLGEHGDERTRSGGLVCLDNGRLEVLPFDELRDASGRIRTRMVDIASEHYKVAREYMIRLRARDLEDDELLSRIASAAKMETDEFVKRFKSVIETDFVTERAAEVVPDEVV
jgi:6-phosphofructokinase 1